MENSLRVSAIINSRWEFNVLENTTEEFKVEWSAYECIRSDVVNKRSMIKMTDKFGAKTHPCGTPLLIC